MCLRKRYIKNIHGDKILVSCGSCPSCLQEKAISRTNKIKNTYDEDKYIPLFVTLTYKNEFLPYILLDELVDKNNFYNSHINVYRDNSTFLYEDRGLKRRVVHQRKVLQVVSTPPKVKCFDLDKYVSARGFNDYNHISVPYFKDFQDFIKRLRINCVRNGLPNNFLYFVCNELGPVTARSHFHALIFVEKEIFVFSKWKDTIIKSWLFSDLAEWSKSVQIAKNVSSYIASYVNSPFDTPLLFRLCKEISPKHSYSKGFGISSPVLSLLQVFEMFRKRDLHYTVERVKQKQSVIDSIIIPKYVISRYCPQFKGFSRLTCFEVYKIVTRPVAIYEYSERLALEPNDCYKIEVMIYNAINRALSFGLNIFDFAEMYSEIWSLRALQVIKDNLINVTDFKDYFQLYDNIDDLYKNKVSNGTLEDLMFDLPTDFNYVVDFNNFDLIVQKDSRLRQSFFSYKKDKDIRNYVLSINNNV